MCVRARNGVWGAAGTSVCTVFAMAAGGRNPQKSAAARAKKEKLMGGTKDNQGGGAAGKAARGGDAGLVANAFEAAAKERAAKNAEKAKREEEKKKKEEAEAKRKKKEAEKASKAGGGAAKGGGGAALGDEILKALEKQLMPLVKKGDGLQEAGDLDGALALYQEAMDGFRAGGFKRPKLKEKLDAVKEKIGGGAAPEPEPEPAAVDESVEIDASVEAGA